MWGKVMTTLAKPYPWFGSKTRIASLVWERFGRPSMYIEPFFGSGAVYLAAKDWQNRLEIINDKDAFVTNFWRAVKFAPGKVVEVMQSSPMDELEYAARNTWLKGKAAGLRDFLRDSPERYDPEIAGYWVWGLSLTIGDGWCAEGKATGNAIPALAGVKGVHGQEWRANAHAMMDALANRLRHTGITCGDWDRVLSKAFLSHGAAVFLDPPYEVSGDVYRVSDSVGKAVVDFCVKNGDNPKLKIALCGYSGTLELPPNWTEEAWTAVPGYSVRSDDKDRNRYRERIWFSPHCLKPAAATFDLMGM